MPHILTHAQRRLAMMSSACHKTRLDTGYSEQTSIQRIRKAAPHRDMSCDTSRRSHTRIERMQQSTVVAFDVALAEFFGKAVADGVVENIRYDALFEV